MATAPDGTKVPVSLVYQKTLSKDGSAPLYLTAYGSYGIPSNVDVLVEPASACSIAASSTRWPTSAAAAISASPGTTRAG